MNSLLKTVLETLIISAILLLSVSVAKAEVALVVSVDSKLTTYDEHAISSLYLAKIKTLPEVGRIVPMDLPEDNPTKKAFYLGLMKKSPDQIRSYWSRLIFTGQSSPPEVMADDQEMAHFIHRNPDTIGYVDSSSVNDTLRVLHLFP